MDSKLQGKLQGEILVSAAGDTVIDADNSIPCEDCASVLTPAGRAAVAVIAAKGKAALSAIDSAFVAANGHPLGDQVTGRITFGHWHDEQGHREEVIVCRTSGATTEVQCHGGPTAVARITQQLADAGCQIIPWQQWLEQESADRIAAEAQIALANSLTLKTSAVLLQQDGGTLKSEIDFIASEIAAKNISEALQRIANLQARIPFGLHLTKPWKVVIAGRPNVGKSSLINALLGYQRAIVFDQPGTTRDVVTATTALDGWPVELIDVAGLRTTQEPLEAAGVELARKSIATADLVLWVVEAGSDIEKSVAKESQELLGPALASPPNNLVPLIVANKIDQLDGTTQATKPELPIVATSALTGEGIPVLIEQIVKRLIPTLPKADEPIPFTLRQVGLLDQLTEAIQADKLEAAKETCNELTVGCAVRTSS
ncbi:GTPase [Adhaeretor mobilis]|uniref:tRNA modification GTPase MnmE n=1 Tax=Adhaeretor mobilis TaxID=1930276 RepID=A0A517N2U4_9BACT|nr:GTPase [Adhaeretor mobilis]QDT01454.1 tRNA modification GTPase MnmE [Adhaeretor mobilis]